MSDTCGIDCGERKLNLKTLDVEQFIAGHSPPSGRLESWTLQFGVKNNS